MFKQILRRFILSFCVLIGSVAIAAAQDAGQVLRLTVGYNTLRNTVSLTAAQRAEVERLGESARAANKVGKYAEAMKHLHHAVTLMRGMAWTPSRALAAALIVTPDAIVLEPGQQVRVKLTQIFAVEELLNDKIAGSIALLKLEGDGVIKVLKTLDSVDADLMAHPVTTEITVPDVEDGNYRMMVMLKPTGKTTSETAAADSGEAKKAITIHIERGLIAKVAAAKAKLAVVKNALNLKRQDSLLAALPSVEYRVLLSDFARTGGVSIERINFTREIREADEIIDALGKGRDPLATRRGDFRKAYRSAEDNTLQPYRVYIPSSYDTSKTYPLIIALHGMGGDENSYFDSYRDGAFKVPAEQRGYIVACPKGREPASMYRGAAERDVMDVIAEMKRAYRIDPDRVYLTGHSMGGFGTWAIAMNYPDIFAALAPVAGGGDPSSMSKIRHIPQLVVHGDADRTVPVMMSRIMVEAAKKLGAEVKYLEIPGGDHTKVAVMTFKDVYDWFDTHQRQKVKGKAAGTGTPSR
ncbi:MAG: prolyl oligopeptidase family serine peptidase [Pyrinomonadaceae bacterium]|nr:prolyl oligopeptidase family serine peptidase [Pyrinomonadaceae bacterium]